MKLQKFRESLKPRSPNQIRKNNTLPPKGIHTNPGTTVNKTNHKELDPKAIKISPPSDSPKIGHKMKIPSNIVLDHETCEAICSRRKTRPTIVTPNSKITVLDGTSRVKDIVLPQPNSKLDYYIKPISR